MITDDKPLVAIFKNDVSILSQMYSRSSYEYTSTGILHRPGLQFYIADWLSRHNHSEDKHEEITGMNLNINSIETCTAKCPDSIHAKWLAIN